MGIATSDNDCALLVSIPGMEWVSNLPPTALIILSLSALILARNVVTSGILQSLSLLVEYVLNPVPSINLETNAGVTDDNGIEDKAPAKSVDLKDAG